MAVSYTLVKYKDVQILTNTAAVDIITYTLEKLENCATYVAVANGTVNPTVSLNLPITSDGEYRLTLVSSGGTAIETIKYFLNLQNSLIADIELVLCGCECNNCEECDDCITQVSALTKHGVFASLSNIDYTTTYLVISEYLKCLLSIDISCVLVNEKYKGQTEIGNSVKLLLSLYFLTMYFEEFNNAIDTDEETYVTSKFNFDVISKCLIKFGVNINEIQLLF